MGRCLSHGGKVAGVTTDNIEGFIHNRQLRLGHYQKPLPAGLNLSGLADGRDLSRRLEAFSCKQIGRKRAILYSQDTVP